MKALRTRGGLAAVAAAAALALTGCSTADTAAIVNGTTITVSEAQEAVRQIKEAQPAAQITTPSAVQALIFAPFINEEAAKSGKGQSDSSAKAALGGTVTNPSRATLDLVKASMVSQQLTQEETDAIRREIAAADITLNPRFGTIDQANAQFGPPQTNWLKPQG